MGDFKTFLRGVINGKLKEVEDNFQADFLERTRDLFNWRPIHWACLFGHLEIVKFLSQQKCNIECEDNEERRPIHWACSYGHLKIVEFLIQCNCELDYRDRDGRTPMEYAMRNGHEPCGNIVKEALERKMEKAWSFYAEALMRFRPEDSLKSFITTDIFHLAIKYADPKFLKSMFIKASSDVQQSIIEDLLQHFADKDEYEAFLNLLETEIIEPKLFSDGETLFTSLLKNKSIKYCLEIVSHATNKKCINLANALNEMPLKIAINTELYDLMCPLIFECDKVNNEDNVGNTALVELFQKLSSSTDLNADFKLMMAIKAIISRGGDIYKETPAGIKIIEFCSRLARRNEIQAFQKIERNRDSQVNKDRVAQNICNICLDRQLDCVFECGHTFCTPCGKEVFRCPMCKAEPTNPKKLFIN